MISRWQVVLPIFCGSKRVPRARGRKSPDRGRGEQPPLCSIRRPSAASRRHHVCGSLAVPGLRCDSTAVPTLQMRGRAVGVSQLVNIGSVLRRAQPYAAGLTLASAALQLLVAIIVAVPSSASPRTFMESRIVAEQSCKRVPRARGRKSPDRGRGEQPPLCYIRRPSAASRPQ